MNKIKLTIVAALALAFAAPVIAQTAPVNATITQTQLGAMVTASGVTLLSGQTVATITQFSVTCGMMNPISTPLTGRITYAASSGSTITQAFQLTSAQGSAVFAAGAALSVSSPVAVNVWLRGGALTESAR